MSRQYQLNKIIGRCIAKKRHEAGLTQEDVAEALNLSTEGYGRYERGETPASLLRLSKLATLFGCGLDELVVETSTGLTAQAQHIANLLQGMSSSDRSEIVSIIEKISALANKSE